MEYRKVKLTEQKLRRIIAEEYQKVYEQEKPDANTDTVDTTKPADSASKLRIALRKLSADASKFKGVDATEAAAIADAIDRLLGKASEGSAASIFSRLGRAFKALKI